MVTDTSWVLSVQQTLYREVGIYWSQAPGYFTNIVKWTPLAEANSEHFSLGHCLVT